MKIHLSEVISLITAVINLIVAIFQVNDKGK